MKNPNHSEMSKSLVQCLNSPDAEVCNRAKADFLWMASNDPALFQANLTDVIKAITGDRKHTVILLATLPILLYAAYIGLIVLLGLSLLLRSFIPVLLGIGIFVPSGIVALVAARGRLNQKRQRLAECLTHLDHFNALPPLIELLEFPNPVVRNAILPPIIRMLSRLGSPDAHRLTFVHRTALARILSTPDAYKFPVAFFMVVLQTFEQIGDSQLLPVVSWLAQGKGMAGQHPPILDAARRCHAHLYERLRRHQAHDTLLRPSSFAEAPHILLRPVTSVPDTAPHELLRADTTPQKQAASFDLPPPISAVYQPQPEALEPLPLRLPGTED
ncbi:MAG: hypothetical protein JWN14_3549 [Chthonomonadales bacterium]|nr:hypothetical protein [Chthonomonadales bacterium]